MEERKGFGSNFGFLMAAIGSAVGLGIFKVYSYSVNCTIDNFDKVLA